MRRYFLLAGFLALTTGCANAGVSQPSVSAIPFYEVKITAPGSRSQGVHGVLYDLDGVRLNADRLTLDDSVGPDSVQTPIGRFVWVRCTHLWSVCGYQRVEPGTHAMGLTNQPMASGMTELRITCEKTTTGWVYRGALFNNGNPVSPTATRIDSPIGLLIRFEGQFSGNFWSGWIPAAWLPAERVFYEEKLEALGSKSQHRVGTLFDDKGNRIEHFDLLPLTTPIGQFVTYRGEYPWQDFGLFHTCELTTRNNANDSEHMVTVDTFRVVEVQTKTGPVFRGELYSRNLPVSFTESRIATPLGPMVRIDDAYLGHAWNGWIPACWLEGNLANVSVLSELRDSPMSRAGEELVKKTPKQQSL